MLMVVEHLKKANVKCFVLKIVKTKTWYVDDNRLSGHVPVKKHVIDYFYLGKTYLVINFVNSIDC